MLVYPSSIAHIYGSHHHCKHASVVKDRQLVAPTQSAVIAMSVPTCRFTRMGPQEETSHFPALLCIGPLHFCCLYLLFLCRYLEEHSLAVPRGQPGCIDALELFGPHVRSWITNSQEALCSACRSLEATTELSSMAATGTAAAPPLGSSEEGGVAPICHEMLQAVAAEMSRYERVISHWPLFGPYLEAALCVVLRAIVAAVSRQCGMTRVRGGTDPFGAGKLAAAGSGASSPMGRAVSRPGSSHHHHHHHRYGSGGQHSPLPGRQPQGHPSSPAGSAAAAAAAAAVSAAANPGMSAQWAWTNLDVGSSSPQRGGRGQGTSGPPRVLLMVREAVLLNSLKRLMVAAPIYEATISKWTGGSGAPPGSGSSTDAVKSMGHDDVALVVGAQFAQVGGVKQECCAGWGSLLRGVNPSH